MDYEEIYTWDWPKTLCCPMCNSPYSAKTPKELNCGHVYCAVCIQYGLTRSGNGEFRCTKCYQDPRLELSPARIKRLPTSHLHTKVCDTINRSRERDTMGCCSTCKTDAKLVRAQYRCTHKDCKNDILCKSCKQVHESHPVFCDHALETLTPKPAVCDRHENEIQAYCYNHHLPLCRSCLALEHKECADVKSIQTTLLDFKPKLEKMSKDCKQLIPSIKDNLKKSAQTMKQLLDKKKELDAQIQGVCIETLNMNRKLAKVETSTQLTKTVLDKIHHPVDVVFISSSLIDEMQGLLEESKLTSKQQRTRNSLPSGTHQKPAVVKEKVNGLFGRGSIFSRSTRKKKGKHEGQATVKLDRAKSSSDLHRINPQDRPLPPTPTNSNRAFSYPPYTISKSNPNMADTALPKKQPNFIDTIFVKRPPNTADTTFVKPTANQADTLLLKTPPSSIDRVNVKRPPNMADTTHVKAPPTRPGWKPETTKPSITGTGNKKTTPEKAAELPSSLQLTSDLKTKVQSWKLTKSNGCRSHSHSLNDLCTANRPPPPPTLPKPMMIVRYPQNDPSEYDDTESEASSGGYMFPEYPDIKNIINGAPLMNDYEQICVALYDFEAADFPGAISIKKDEKMSLLRDCKNGWSEVAKYQELVKGRYGTVPTSYIKIITQ